MKLCKSMDWFLCDRDLCHERVNFYCPGIIINHRRFLGEQKIIRSIRFLLEAKFGDNLLLLKNVLEIGMCSMFAKNLRHRGVFRTLSWIFFISSVTENEMEVNICLTFFSCGFGVLCVTKKYEKSVFLGGAPSSMCQFPSVRPSVCLSVRPSVRPSVTHHISRTVHHLMIVFITHVQNDDISRRLFHFCEIFIFWAVRGVKGQKLPKMKNHNYIRHVPNLRNSIANDHDFWYTCVK